MGDVLNLQAMIGRCGRDEERKYQVGTICECIIMKKLVLRQSASLGLQAEEGMDKTKYRALS